MFGNEWISLLVKLPVTHNQLLITDLKISFIILLITLSSSLWCSRTKTNKIDLLMEFKCVKCSLKL